MARLIGVVSVMQSGPLRRLLATVRMVDQHGADNGDESACCAGLIQTEALQFTYVHWSLLVIEAHKKYRTRRRTPHVPLSERVLALERIPRHGPPRALERAQERGLAPGQEPVQVQVHAQERVPVQVTALGMVKGLG